MTTRFNKKALLVIISLLIVGIVGVSYWKKSQQIIVSEQLDSTSKLALEQLQSISEINLIQQAIKKNGRTTFLTPENKNGDLVVVAFYESGFPDNHTTRIDTFNVNVKTKVITVDDVAMISGKQFISLEEWKKSVKQRYP